MANRIDRVGSYRFDKVLEEGVDTTKKSKMPSYNVRVRISEFFDEDEKVWVDWSSSEIEQTCYFCLYGEDKKTSKVGPIFNHEQVMKVFDWDGKSFLELGATDHSKTKGQIRIGDNDPEYADRNPFSVEWLDVFDADPVRTLSKLDEKGLKDLDTKWATVLQNSGKASAPAAAPGKNKKAGPAAPPKTKKSATPPAPASEEKESEGPTDEEKKAALKAKSEKNKAAAKGKRPAPPVPPKKETEPETAEPDAPDPEKIDDGRRYTKSKAWEVVVELTTDGVTDKQRQKAWLDAIELIAGDIDDADITEAQWGEIVTATLDTEYEDGKTIGKF